MIEILVVVDATIVADELSLGHEPLVGLNKFLMMEEYISLAIIEPNQCVQAVVEHDDREGKNKGCVLAEKHIGVLLVVLPGKGLQNPLDLLRLQILMASVT